MATVALATLSTLPLTESLMPADIWDTFGGARLEFDGVTLRNTATIPALSPLAGKVPGIAPMLNGPVGLDYLGYASSAGLLLRNLTVHDTQRRAWLQLNPHWDADSIVGNVRVIQPSCFANSSKPLPNLKVQCQPKMKSDDALPIVLHVASAGPRHLKSDDREVALFVCCDIAAGEWGAARQLLQNGCESPTLESGFVPWRSRMETAIA